jgi:hypothetical protein
MRVLRRLLFRLLCPGVLLLGELHVWLADQVRGTTGWRRSFALLGWAPCRAVFVAGYGALVLLDEPPAARYRCRLAAPTQAPRRVFATPI